MELVGQLKAFRSTHAIKRVRLDDVDWNYLAGGRGQEVLVFLHGTSGAIDSPFQQIMLLEHQYRVISLTYPTVVKTVAEMTRGILAVLGAEGVMTAHFIGISLGGAVAQALVREAPGTIQTLILSHTIPPSLAIAPRLVRRLKIVSIVPHRLVLTGAKRQYMRRLKSDALDIPPVERDFWLAFGEEIYSHSLTKYDFLARLKVHLDFHISYRFSPTDLVDWPGRILIIESDGDEIIPASLRNELKAAYPEAAVHTFHGVGHSSGLIKSKESAALIRSFVERGKVN